ncbi:MAG: alpha/beta hydrolase fold domain-containing protein [Lachnospiraceae bacterium]|nr:alpha/beta hydrolase fold domain-containing protein [Lachnospiraceae bacterium]
MKMSEIIISKAVQKIRTEWAVSDAKRDEGLTTPENILRHDNISYGPYDEWNLLDVYYTKDVVAPQPVIVNIHGGGWVYGNKEIYQFYCMSLAQRGFTVVNFNYRLAPENRYPAALEDINNVFCFLEKEGAKYMADINNVFVVGDSAGAQLTSQYLTIMTNPEYAKLFTFKTPDITVRACGLNCGLYDARKCAERGLDECFIEYIGRKVTKLVYADEQLLDSLDVLKHMTKEFPPAYVMSAHNDFLLPDAEPMYQHLQSLGVDTELKIYGSKEQEEIAHVFHVNCKLEEAVACNDAECNFFKKYIK